MHSSETIKVVPARYPLRVVGALVALLVLAVVIQSVAFNPRWEWGVFARWFFDPVILEGLGQTLLLTLLFQPQRAGAGLRRPAGAGPFVLIVAAQQSRLGLYLAVSLAAADCGADHSL